jgi:molybdopterin-guanine dinucleotide biosynthesis protein A
VVQVSVAILAGGKSNRFRQTKALTPVAGKPLFLHVVDACKDYADEIFIVTHTENDRKALAKFFPEDLIYTDSTQQPQCPLVGASTAFSHSKYPYTQLFPCDSPLIHNMFFEIMWNMVENHNAGVPRWPNAWIEPLHSIYRTDIAQQVAKECLQNKDYQMRCLIDNLNRVIYLSTVALSRFDTKLDTFLNINTPADLRRLEQILQSRQKRWSKF